MEPIRSVNRTRRHRRRSDADGHRSSSRTGQLAEAEEVYRRILEVAPDHPDVVHFSGVLAHQQGRSDEAIALIERSLSSSPIRPTATATSASSSRRWGGSTRRSPPTSRRSRSIPTTPTPTTTSACCCRAQGQAAEAEAAYRKAIELNPEHIDAYHNLGVLLASSNRTPEAVVCYCKVIDARARAPGRAPAAGDGALHARRARQGDRDLRAVDRGRARQSGRAAHAGRLFRARTCRRGRRTPTSRRCSTASRRASTRSSRSCPTARRRWLPRCSRIRASRRPRTLDVLDAGCGTGLCGPLVAPYARRLVGVDLSSGMLAQGPGAAGLRRAGEGRADGSSCSAARAAFDLIVSADTLVYFGALEQVCRAAAAALRPGGLFVFTLEERSADAEDSAPPATASAITAATCTRVATSSGCCGGAASGRTIVHAELRMESGAPVAGLVVRATTCRRCPCLESWRSPRRLARTCCSTACTRARS